MSSFESYRIIVLYMSHQPTTVEDHDSRYPAVRSPKTETTTSVAGEMSHAIRKTVIVVSSVISLEGVISLLYLGLL